MSYRVIRLWEEDPQAILDSGLTGLLPLLPLMAGSSTNLLEESLTTLEERLKSSQERTNLMKAAALLASLRIEPNVILSILRDRAMLNLLEDTPLGQQLLAEREARGREAGQVEGLRQAVMRQIAHRFDTVPEDVRQQLHSISEMERLGRLLDAAYAAADLEAFRRQLNP